MRCGECIPNALPTSRRCLINMMKLHQPTPRNPKTFVPLQRVKNLILRPFHIQLDTPNRMLLGDAPQFCSSVACCYLH